MIKIKNLLRLSVVLLAVTIASCGGASNSTETVSTGTAGPTVSGYYFTATAAPSIVAAGGSSTITARVWSGTSTPVVGASVNFSGDIKTASAITTGSTGTAVGFYTITGGAGVTSLVTITVENLSQNVSVQVVP